MAECPYWYQCSCVVGWSCEQIVAEWLHELIHQLDSWVNCA